jgi:hypothetical protein
MSRIVLLCGAALALAGSLVSAYLARPRCAVCDDELVATPPTHQFGQLRQGATVTATFDLSNRCSVPVHIDRVMTNCDCTEHKLSASDLQPGEAASLTVTWHVGAKRGEVSTHASVVYRRQGAAQSDQVSIRLTADVVPDVVCSPSRLVFESGRAAKQSLHFSSDRLEGRLLLQAFCTQQAFTAVLSPDGDSVEVAFDPALWPGGNVRAELVVRTISSNEPNCRIELEVKD